MSISDSILMSISLSLSLSLNCLESTSRVRVDECVSCVQRVRGDRVRRVPLGFERAISHPRAESRIRSVDRERERERLKFREPSLLFEVASSLRTTSSISFENSSCLRIDGTRRRSGWITANSTGFKRLNLLLFIDSTSVWITANSTGLNCECTEKFA